MVVKRRRLVNKELTNDFSSNTDRNAFLSEDKKDEGKKKFPKFVFVLVLAILAFLLYKNKDIFLAGTVDGKPIFAWELNGRLRQRYGQQAIQEIISERLVLAEANKKGIKATEKEIQDKIAEIEKGLGGQAKLPDVLKQQGLTMVDFRMQVELRILVDKMIGTSIKVNQKEIDDFLVQNKDNIETYAGTDSAKQKAYAEDSLKQQKTSEAFDKWFNDLKSKAKITTYSQP